MDMKTSPHSVLITARLKALEIDHLPTNVRERIEENFSAALADELVDVIDAADTKKAKLQQEIDEKKAAIQADLEKKKEELIEKVATKILTKKKTSETFSAVLSGKQPHQRKAKSAATAPEIVPAPVIETAAAPAPVPVVKVPIPTPAPVAVEAPVEVAAAPQPEEKKRSWLPFGS